MECGCLANDVYGCLVFLQMEEEAVAAEEEVAVDQVVLAAEEEDSATHMLANLLGRVYNVMAVNSASERRSLAGKLVD